MQAYCADSCRQRMRADKALVHWASEKINQGRRRSAELAYVHTKHQKAPQSDPNWLKLRPVSCSKSTICSRLGYPGRAADCEVESSIHPIANREIQRAAGRAPPSVWTPRRGPEAARGSLMCLWTMCGSREADDGNGKYIIIIATHGHALCLWWGGAGRREGRCAETHTVLPASQRRDPLHEDTRPAP